MAEAVKVKDERDERDDGAQGNGAGRALEAVRRPFRRFGEFLHEVRVEMRNVTWPTMLDVRATTIVVIATVIFFGIFLFIVDRGAGWIVQEIFRRLKP